jgi:hypothetical protein
MSHCMEEFRGSPAQGIRRRGCAMPGPEPLFSCAASPGAVFCAVRNFS